MRRLSDLLEIVRQPVRAEAKTLLAKNWNALPESMRAAADVWPAGERLRRDDRRDAAVRFCLSRMLSERQRGSDIAPATGW